MTAENLTKPPKLLVLTVIILWISTAIAGIVVIPTTLDVTTRVYAAFWADQGFYGEVYQGAVFVRQMMSLVLGTLYVGGIIGSAEYHSRHFNTPQSWDLFSKVIAIETSLLLLSVMI